MNTYLRKTALYLLAIATLSSVAFFGTGCSTARGFGRDLGHVGHEIERAAR